jgi:hypothetical protein
LETYCSPSFNSQTDLDLSLASQTIPILSQKQVIAVVQVIFTSDKAMKMNQDLITQIWFPIYIHSMLVEVGVNNCRYGHQITHTLESNFNQSLI